MRAEEMRLAPLLGGPRQFVVPYFQRVYSWRNEQWSTLFDDILELYELGPGHTHFLGSIVLLADAAGEARAPALVIDGQQRLVTLSLLLAAVRDSVRNVDPVLADEVHRGYLVNPDRSAEEELKVLCTQQDRAAFASVVLDAQEPPPSPMRDAYRTFRQSLASQVERGLDLAQLVHIVTADLSFVAITLDAGDNAYRIFESLNAKGMPLTQGDLLRNYFFMRLPQPEHERWYSTVWLPMQRRLGEDLDAFMRDFLLKDGHVVRPDEVYQEWRKRLAPLAADDIRTTLRELADWSTEYEHVRHPPRTTDSGVRAQLAWLSAWSRTLLHSIDPLLMRLHADHRRGELSVDQTRQLFTAIASFLVRRAFAATPAADENQLLIGIYDATCGASDRAAEFQRALSEPRIGWPGDADFIEGVLRYPIYFGSHPDRRALILQALEDSYEHRQPVRYEQLELQLITPLLPRPDWLAEVGVAEDEYWKVIGTLGNLTWTLRGRTPDLGVAERKKELRRMARYGLELVRDFAQVERWSAAEIQARSRRLAERAVHIWPGPRR